MANGEPCVRDGCENPTTTRKYCSTACSSKAYRERKRVATAAVDGRKRRTLPENELKSVQREVIKEAIGPAIRESLTEDVLAALGKLVQLTPQVVEAIEEDLHSDNAFLRQHAYQTLLKYTVGNKGLVPDLDEDAQPMTVIINGIERPSTEAARSGQDRVTMETFAPEGPVIEPESGLEYKECNTCHIPKPLDQFVASSDRCTQCFERMRASAAAATANAG